MGGRSVQRRLPFFYARPAVSRVCPRTSAGRCILLENQRTDFIKTLKTVDLTALSGLSSQKTSPLKELPAFSQLELLKLAKRIQDPVRAFC
jgi:hypothetical protein